MKKLILVSFVLLFAVSTAGAQSQEYISIRIDYQEKLGHINQKIFDAVMEGRIKAFRDDMETTYSKEEVAERSRRETIIQIYPDANDPHFYIDSIALMPFQDQVTGYAVDYGENQEITSIAFVRNEEETTGDAASLVPQNMFRVRWKHLVNFLNERELHFLEKFINVK
ncbi:MAG: hypothetical protein WD077_03530 [Bacteroidia bacterium]